MTPTNASEAARPDRAAELRVLEERAQLLARPLEEKDPGEAVHLITFELGGERFALEARFALEVARVRTWTPLPGATLPLAGLTAWRGDLLTLYDLTAAVGRAGSRGTAAPWALVLQGTRSPFGVPIDAPGEFLILSASELHPPPEELPLAHGWVRWLARQDLLVLDGERVLRLHS